MKNDVSSILIPAISISCELCFTTKSDLTLNVKAKTKEKHILLYAYSSSVRGKDESNPVL